MIDTATPEQALLAWAMRSDERQWFIEPVGLLKLRFVMREIDTGNPARVIRAYLNVALDGRDGIASPHDISDLIKIGLDKWIKEFQTLS